MYREIVSKSIVSGLGTTIGVLLGLAAATPFINYFFSDGTKQTRSSNTRRQTNSTQTSEADDDRFKYLIDSHLV